MLKTEPCFRSRSNTKICVNNTSTKYIKNGTFKNRRYKCNFSNHKTRLLKYQNVAEFIRWQQKCYCNCRYSFSCNVDEHLFLHVSNKESICFDFSMISKLIFFHIFSNLDSKMKTYYWYIQSLSLGIFSS